MSVSHAKHWQIRRSVCKIKIFVRFVPYVSAPLRTKIREIREIRVRPLSSSSMCKKLFVLFVFKKNLVFKMMSVQDDEWFKMMSGSR